MWYNKWIGWILKSPLHHLVSRNMVLLSYTGRRSGKTYETPVNYVRLGNCLLITSQRQRTWWRNFMDGVPLRVWMDGKAINAHASVLIDPADVALNLGLYLAATPKLAKYYQVRLEPHGQLNTSDIDNAAKSRLIVLVEIAPV
jgi:hypothetical protein